MQFSKGQVVVHPQHGPATVEQVTSRVVQGVTRRYVSLAVHADGMTVALPVEVAEEVGVRSVMDPAHVREVVGVLVAESEPFDKVWSRRQKNNTERLRSGDLPQIAALVRDLTRRNDEKPISYGEGNLLREGLELLAAELAIVLGVSEDRAVELVESAVRDRGVPEPLAGELLLAS